MTPDTNFTSKALAPHRRALPAAFAPLGRGVSGPFASLGRGVPPAVLHIEALTRREFMFSAFGGALLIACGDDEDDSDSTGSATSAFPRTVTHKQGSAEIPAQPQRVAAVTEGEPLDHLLAVGITPVLYGQTPGYDGLGLLAPWARDAATGVLTKYDAPRGEPDMERFAAATPDLIIGGWTTPEQYALLSDIAPTVIIKMEDATAWPEMQRLVGQATGREAEAEAALAETDAVIAANAERLKPFTDRTVMVGYKFFEELFLHGPDTPIARLVERMGLKVTGAPDAPQNELTTFSTEQVNRYQDADILLSPWFFPEDQTAMEDSPLFRSLPAVQAGRYMPLSLDVAQAGYLESTLSVRWVVPQLADAIIEAAEGRGKQFA